MGVISDVVGEGRALGLRRCKLLKMKPWAEAGRLDFSLQHADRPATAQDWAVVLGQAFQGLVAQIKSIEARILALEPCHHPEALCIVVKSTKGHGCRRQGPL